MHTDKYLVLLQEVLPERVTDVPAPVLCHVWFQQDGAPSHCERFVRAKKSIMYYTPDNSEMDLVVRISLAAATFVKCPVVSNKPTNPCRVGVQRA
ncbi:hypothetical protein TNCV_3889571 [Trichonephila clavipes]|nr:hypothetical protein TNCV_3889571 [Trichonephila clavipes]